MLSISSLITASATSITGFTASRQKILANEVIPTLCYGSGMCSGEDGLSFSSLSLQRLGDGTNLVSDLGVLVDLGLEVLKDPRIDHSRA